MPKGYEAPIMDPLHSVTGNCVKKRKSYSGAFKAEILRQILNGGRSLIEVADQYQVHPNQIKNWKSRLMKRAQLVLEDERHRK
jgi:transposase